MHCTNAGELMRIRSGFDARLANVRLAPSSQSLMRHCRLPDADIGVMDSERSRCGQSGSPTLIARAIH